MKKLLLAVLVAGGCLHSASIQAMGAAAAAGAGAEKAAQEEETVESITNQMMQWVDRNIPANSLGAFNVWIFDYAPYLLQQEVVTAIATNNLTVKKPDVINPVKISSLAEELASDIKQAAMEKIPNGMKDIFYEEFRKKLFSYKLIRLYNTQYINYRIAYDIVSNMNKIMRQKKASKIAQQKPNALKEQAAPAQQQESLVDQQN